jgi:hypothetical protein
MTNFVLSDDDILTIRDRHLPSQGESFDTLAFGREVAVEALKDASVRATGAVNALDVAIRTAIGEAKRAGVPQSLIVGMLQGIVHAQTAAMMDGS